MTKSRTTRPALGIASKALLVLNWLAERDRRFREASKLRRMPEERLLDMGMSRRDVAEAFRRTPQERQRREGVRKARLS